MKEVEKKELISKEQYLACLAYLMKKQIGNRKLQVNYYYDTDDFRLYTNNETLRVRQIEDQLKLEYKHNKTIENNVRTCDEYTQALDSLPSSIDNDALNIHNCKYIGSLITERYDFKLNNSIISLDKNYYLGTLDYEIEIETEDDFQGIDFINPLGFTFEKPLVGKYQRFVDLLKSRNAK